MESFGRDSILRGSHVPCSGKPHRQRGAGSVENGPCGYRDPLLAAVTPETSIAHPPTTWGFTARAYKPFRPAKPFEMVEAGRIIREPCPQFRRVARIVASRSQLGGRRYCQHPNILYLQHSDGYPLLGMGIWVILHELAIKNRVNIMISVSRSLRERARVRGVCGLFYQFVALETFSIPRHLCTRPGAGRERWKATSQLLHDGFPPRMLLPPVRQSAALGIVPDHAPGCDLRGGG